MAGMSWGYFLDLDLTLPTADWTRIAATRSGDHAIPAEWWGFEDRALADMFGGSDFDDMTIGKAVALFARPESIGRVEANGDETTLRLCQLLDRGGDPSLAKPIAALVEAAKSTARGALRLVNDGSYSGEGGIVVRVEGGTLARERLDDDIWPIVEQLGAEIFGAEIFEDGGDGDGDGEDD